MPIVVARQLSKHYGVQSSPVKALDAVDLHVEDAERVSLIGKSGSGKTTLLNLLAGLDRPTSGELVVSGKCLGALSADELARYRCCDIGVVFQSFQLLSHRNALQNVEVPLMLQGVSYSDRRQRSAEALERVGLIHRADHRPSELSGGEQQRVAIARAIVHRPSLILADEPTGNLDSKNANTVMELILEVVSETDAAMLLITHDSALAESAATRTLTLSDGKIQGRAA